MTFLFTDIEGSTRLAQLLGDNYRPVLHDHRTIMRKAFTAYEGAELLTEGDSFFAAFADASTALRACVNVQRALARHSWPTPAARPRVRMGLHTGYAIPQDGEYASYEVHRAARVAAAAHGGQIICSATTASRAASIGNDLSLMALGLHRLRGFDDRERLFQVVADDLEQHFPPPRTLDATPHNLPAASTSFIGRTYEREELRKLITQQRLVTVLGPGGCGKTRLAVSTAMDLVPSYPDGVWFTDLAAVSDPRLIPTAVAEAMGVRPEPGRAIVDTLTEYALNRRCLLIFDTCDYVLPEVARLVDRLLTHCPWLTILTTSREPVGMPGEVVWRLPALAVAAGSAGEPSEAVALLLDRASAARGGQSVADTEYPHLDRIARTLEGLPLALELAAPRLRVLTASQLAQRLDEVLLGDVDTPDVPLGDEGTDALADDQGISHRHMTLGATLAWSYRNLRERPAALLRHLSVFAGPVDLDAIEWMFGNDVLESLAKLVDKSLVHVESTTTGTTYRLLGPIRQYAQRKLTQAGEEAAVRDRHAVWCRYTIEQAARDELGRLITLSMYSIDPIADQVDAALNWTSTHGDVREGIRLAILLDQWWRERGLTQEARAWLYRLYERMSISGEHVPAADLARAYQVHAAHAGSAGEYTEALRFSLRAEAAARQADDAEILVRVLAARGNYLAGAGLTIEGERTCREALRLAAEYKIPAQGLFAVYHLAQLLWRRGALEEASSTLASARSWESAWPAERGHRTVDMLLGLVALDRGDIVAAHEHLQVALRSRMTHGFSARAVETLSAIAVRCRLGGMPEEAVLLFGAAEAERARLRSTAGAYAPYWAKQHTLCRRVLGDRRFDELYAEGGEWTLEQAAKVALAVEHPDLSSGGLLAARTRTVAASSEAPTVVLDEE